MSFKQGRIVGTPLVALFCSNAAAHSFGNIYTLPIPFWMYAFSASAALVLSFVVVGYFVSAQSAARKLFAPMILLHSTPKPIAAR